MCDCVDRIDAALTPRNRRLVLSIPLDGAPARPIVWTEPIARRRGERHEHLIAAFCPFCGERLARGER